MQLQEAELSFQRITESDIPELTQVMKRAFDDDSRRFLGRPRGGPPGYDTGEFIRKWAVEAGGQGWKIIADGRAVGAFIVFVTESENATLGTIFVDTPVQDQKFGTRTWEFIEATYPCAGVWSLETPTWAVRNHHFYEKLGFVRVEIDGDQVVYRKESMRP